MNPEDPLFLPQEIIPDTPKLHDFVGVRSDLYLNMGDVKYVYHDETVEGWFIRDKHITYFTTLSPDEAKEPEHYVGPRTTIVLEDTEISSRQLELFGSEAIALWEYMCEHYVYLRPDTDDSPQIPFT